MRLFSKVPVDLLNLRYFSGCWYLDWDVHHGNGTQHMFYEDPRYSLSVWLFKMTLTNLLWQLFVWIRIDKSEGKRKISLQNSMLTCTSEAVFICIDNISLQCTIHIITSIWQWLVFPVWRRWRFLHGRWRKGPRVQRQYSMEFSKIKTLFKLNNPLTQSLLTNLLETCMCI